MGCDMEYREGRMELDARLVKMGRKTGEPGKALSWWSLVAVSVWVFRGVD